MTSSTGILLCDRLEHWARVRPDAAAITFGEQAFTWAQWRQRIARLAGALRASGIGAGDRLAVFDLNHLAAVEVTLAASSLGAATVVANFRWSPDQLRYALEDCRPGILLYGAQLADVVTDAGAGALVPRLVVVGGGDDGYEPFLAAGEPGAATGPGAAGQPGAGTRAEAEPDDVCLVLYTSGTTGRPKGAQLTHRNVLAHSVAANSALQMGTDSVSMVAMPLFHVGGSGYAQVGIHAGAHTILLREAAPAALFGAIARGATHAFIVPTIIHGVLAAGEEAIAAFAGLTTIAYGASPMPLPLLQRALSAWPGTRFIQVYGMTELAGAVTALSPEAHRDQGHPERLTSAGLPLPGVEARVVDPVTLDDAQPGAAGEVWIRTIQAMPGYLNRAEATAQLTTADGWLRTGDIGRADAAGFLYILDRIKDMIISGGENVYGPEVESVLNACPGVAEGVVIGIPDERWGEAVKAVVIPAPGTEPTEAAAAGIIAFCRDRLAHYQCPASVDFVAELPRNATGKVLKRALREPYLAARERPPSPLQPRETG